MWKVWTRFDAKVEGVKRSCLLLNVDTVLYIKVRFSFGAAEVVVITKNWCGA